MTDVRTPRPGFVTGLSGRLLALTICFVMLAEVLIFAPSISRFRMVYLEDQIAKAHLAVLALEASPSHRISDRLAKQLLANAGAHAVVLRGPQRRMLILSERMPPSVDVVVDVADATVADWIGGAFAALVQRENRILRVVGSPPGSPDVVLEVLLDEAPMRREMLAFSWRILTLSIIISLISAGLVYFALQWLMVRPIARLTASMVRFGTAPEDERATLEPSRRRDEIGVAEREFAALQQQVRAALRQKTRLALLGSAVAKVHHDLRNILSTAVLASDRLATIDDPEVQRLVPRLYGAIDRAVALTSRTLDFAREDRPPLHPTTFRLRDLLGDVARASPSPGPDGGDGVPSLAAAVPPDLEIEGDREQLFRVFNNLVLNAMQAGARSVTVAARPVDSTLVIEVGDDGPGIPAPVRERLFTPFAATMRSGGTGLGLVIARDIVAAHGGALDLAHSGPDGTRFRIELPIGRARPA